MGEWFPCDTPVTYVALDPATWNFTLRLRTSGGGVAGSPVSSAFTVELGDGVYARFTAGPYGVTMDPNLEYFLVALQGPDGEQVSGAEFTCFANPTDGGQGIAVNSTGGSCAFGTMPDGEYEVLGVAVGSNGGEDTVAVYPLKIDTVAPDLTLVGSRVGGVVGS